METGGFHDKTAITKHARPWILSRILANIKKTTEDLLKLLSLCITCAGLTVCWFQMLVCLGLPKVCTTDHSDRPSRTASKPWLDESRFWSKKVIEYDFWIPVRTFTK